MDKYEELADPKFQRGQTVWLTVYEPFEPLSRVKAWCVRKSTVAFVYREDGTDRYVYRLDYEDGYYRDRVYPEADLFGNEQDAALWIGQRMAQGKGLTLVDGV